MWKRYLCSLALAAVAVSPARAEASDVANWATVGGWSIKVDRTLGDSCFAFAPYEGGTVLRIGVDAQKEKIYFLVGHDGWKSLEEGKIYPVRIVFDGAKDYQGEMRGHRINGFVVLAHRDLSTDFVRDFMQRNGMEIFYRGAKIASLSLRNTFAAVREVINCQREIGFSGSGSTNRRSDPFVSTPGPGSRDPFR